MTYLRWLSEILIPDRDVRESYQNVMLGLYEAVFTIGPRFYNQIKNDENRAADGLDLRELYEQETGLICEKEGDCSILEMLGALALKCENDLMYDPDEGNRVSVWFWDMIDNMGLTSLDDWHWDLGEFDLILWRLNNRAYERDGYGGPFYIEGITYDMRKMELWYQLNYYVRSKYDW